MPGAAADVDAVVRVGGVAEDALVLLVEGVHRAPRDGHLALQDRGVPGERDVLPGRAGGAARVAGDLEPGGLAELRMLGAALDRHERAVGEVADREVGDGVAAGLEEQDGVVALHDGAARRSRRASGAAAARRTARAPACPGTRNRPFGLRPSGPCCHERPIVCSALQVVGDDGHERWWSRAPPSYRDTRLRSIRDRQTPVGGRSRRGRRPGLAALGRAAASRPPAPRARGRQAPRHPAPRGAARAAPPPRDARRIARRPRARRRRAAVRRRRDR